MKNGKFILIGFVLISLVIVSGCDGIQNGGSQQVQTSAAQTQEAENQIETIVAQTMTAISQEKALTEGAPTEVTATPTPTESPTLTFSPSPTPSMTPTLTATVSTSMAFLEVTVPTNCRTGPGKIYDRVSVLDVKESVEIVARNADGTYWIVKNPGGPGVCWLWDEYAVVTGQTANLPVWDTPPTSTPKASVSPTATGVVLKVSVPTNCRVGPGKTYDKIGVLEPGKTVNVIARNASSDYWVVENPEGSGTCWVWGYYATVTGATANVPVWSPPSTPTPATVTLQVSVDTNCRSGPGKAYDILTILRIGKTAEVVARNYNSSYWVINNPLGSGQCWVWGYYADVTGPAASLPVWDNPPTPTPTP